MTRQPNMLTIVAQDLADWLDMVAEQLADGLTAGGQAPFAADLTEKQKLEYYVSQLFNPDGTPNLQGRAKEMQRLGAEGFAATYKAVIKAHPNLAIAPPPPGAVIPTNQPAEAI